MLREHYQEGRLSLPAAGELWEESLRVLTGPAIREEHLAAFAVREQNGAESNGGRPPLREIRRIVDERLFERLPEERALLSYFIATFMEEGASEQDLWMQHKIRRSQFPALDDENIHLVLNRIVQELRG